VRWVKPQLGRMIRHCERQRSNPVEQEGRAGLLRRKRSSQ
jgi:hypothetical protein